MAQDQAAAAGAMAPQVDVRAPPKGVKFGSLLPMGVKGKQVTRKLFPQNGSTFSSATNNVIRIPLNGPFFLNGGDSYLSFDVAVKNSGSSAITAAKLDSSAHSLINRLRIEGPDGSEVERIEDYASLHCFYTDFQQGAEHTWTQHGMSYVADRNGFPQANGLAATPNAISTDAVVTSNAGAPASINTAGALLCPATGREDELYFPSTLGIPFVYCGTTDDNRNNMLAQASTAPVFDFAQGNASVKTGTGTSGQVIAASGSTGDTSGYLKICIKLLSGVLANKRYIPVSGLTQTDLVVVP